jgi:Holliday junction resolvase RusA-like endonuclease
MGARGAYTPEKTRAAEDALGWTLRAAMKGRAPLDGLIRLDVQFFCKTHRRLDFDNLAKLVGDAGNGIVWQDDSQIVDGRIKVERGATNPRTELTVYAIDVEVAA